MRVKTPADIARDRASYERYLDQLDEAEQYWENLSPAARTVELIHKEECKALHYKSTNEERDYCDFEATTWGGPLSGSKLAYQDKMEKLVAAIPCECTEEQLMEIWKVLL